MGGYQRLDGLGGTALGREQRQFGAKERARVDQLDVRWPSGRTEIIRDVAANHIVTIREGDGIVRAVPFAK